MLFFKKKQEKKSYGMQDWFAFNFLKQEYSSNNSASAFINYFYDACPVFTATNLITDSISSIDIVLKNKKTGDFIYKHKALDIIKNPNPFTDSQLFIKEIASYYLLTGNAYINIIGEALPIEINNIKPTDITILAGNDGYMGEYNLSTAINSTTYTRDGKKRFIDTKKNELIHLRSFNPKFSSTNLVGCSAFIGCQLEISQFVSASIHNYSLLKNGARPSGMITYKGTYELQAEQIDKIKQVMKEKLSGAKNAGELAFLSGDFDWKQLSESMKDMDFPKLKQSVNEAIYNALKIPLPMISSQNMTFSNLDTAKYAYYDNAVLPILKRILNFLSTKLLTRYPGTEELEYYFDESAIESLEARKFENAMMASKIGILSDNEIRAMIGYEAISGGDVIYKPANQAPVGQDINTADNRDEPMAKAEFIKIMKDQQKQDGGNFYTDEYIELKAKEFYGN
jgi:HK97 family phage portal protein